MTDEQHMSSEQTKKKLKMITVVLLLAAVYLFIEIAKSGYAFGQWLQRVLN